MNKLKLQAKAFRLIYRILELDDHISNDMKLVIAVVSTSDENIERLLKENPNLLEDWEITVQKLKLEQLDKELKNDL